MRRLSLIVATLFCLIAVCSLLTPKGRTQEITTPRSADVFHTTASNIIIPQARSYALDDPQNQIQISEVTAEVRILQQVATTTMDVGLTNPTDRVQEAEMLVPVPDGAVVRAFTFAGSAKEPTAKLLPKGEAKMIYRSIVSKLKDPALLEFAGYNLVRSSVFPVPAHGTQRVRLVYEHILAADGNRVDYVLPRSESFEATETPWKISVRVNSRSPISAVYSPSHLIGIERPAPQQAVVKVAGDKKIEPGAFRLSYLVEGNGLTASLLAYPDARVGGGYFLLLAGVPASFRGAQENTIKREITLVIDRSGSMAGEKIEQARAAALQVVEGLNMGEAFNIIDYSDSIARFSERPVIKTDATIRQARAYIKRLRSDGGTNIHDALVEALLQSPTPHTLPLVLFLTDGLPTVGERRETAIRSAVLANNKHNRRIFSFGVGFDVNAPLLTSIANSTRATSSFVFPNENVEAKVSQVFARLAGPVLAEPQLAMVDSSGSVTTRAVRELLPAQLNDVFEGDQIVLLGQYQGDDPLHFRINGNYLGAPKTFDFKFDLKKATTRNAFVPRLWASRKIARLIETISEAGADNAQLSRSINSAALASNARSLSAGAHISSVGSATGSGAALDPRLKELVDEIVRLSTEFGVLTEYTAFLATDGTDFSRPEELNEQARQGLVNSAQNTRSGMGGVTQAVNGNAQMTQSSANRSNFFLNQNMQRVEITNVQQITDRTFFRRNDRWIDARVLDREKALKPDQTIEFGTPEFYRLVDRLVGEGRQGILALSGEMLLSIDGKTVLIKAPPKE
ncbi:MAG: VWA domain-containing protein [Pyrinomonadaceae bacterium]|nr:VWA domain-containing protein [Pyrinomonadaceae bacterium]